MKALSVIVITLNEAKRIGNVLGDLALQSYQNFEVILVDSNSQDDTCQIAKTYADKLPSLTVHQMDKRGVALGRNTGAALAKYERLLFLDADVRLSADFLARAVSLLSDDIGAAGVYMQTKTMPIHFKLSYMAFNAGLFLTQFASPTAVGACLFSTKTIHQAIGGFDATITLCEDCDYVKRTKRLSRASDAKQPQAYGKFVMLPLHFGFDPRRLQQDGLFRTGFKYVYANAHRFIIGEIRDQRIRYDFGHYRHF